MAGTLRDVAELAGVSVRTVSNVVNDFAHVAPTTRACVQAAIDELGYRPNAAARSLRSGRSGMLGLLVPEIDQPYFAELARDIVSAATERGYTVLIDQTDADRSRELDLLARTPQTSFFDGLILNPLTLRPDDLKSETTNKTPIPIVLLGERMLEDPFDHVYLDNVTAAKEATNHLLDLGRRRIAAIGLQNSEAGQSAHLRMRGYLKALKEFGIEPDDSLLGATVDFHRSDGYQAMGAILEAGSKPDAVFCFNDALAFGAMRRLTEAGLRVPDDVAVIGFDDTEEGRYSTPTLSTVRPQREQIAAQAVDLLLRRIEDPSREPTEIIVGHSLVTRESTMGRRNL